MQGLQSNSMKTKRRNLKSIARKLKNLNRRINLNEISLKSGNKTNKKCYSKTLPKPRTRSHKRVNCNIYAM